MANIMKITGQINGKQVQPPLSWSITSLAFIGYDQAVKMTGDFYVSTLKTQTLIEVCRGLAILKKPYPFHLIVGLVFHMDQATTILETAGVEFMAIKTAKAQLSEIVKETGVSVDLAKKHYDEEKTLADLKAESREVLKHQNPN